MSDAELADAERVEREFARLAASGRSRRPVVASRRRRARPAQPGRVAARARARCPRSAAATSWPRCRCPATRPSAPRCWPSCASTPRSAARASTTSSSGRDCGSPRARRRSRCGWPPSSARGVRLRRGRARGSTSASAGVRVTLADGEQSRPRRSSARSPPGRCATVEISRPQRRAAALAARPAPRAGGQGRGRLRRAVLAAQRPERAGRDASGCSARRGRRAPGVLSMLVPPERLSAFLAAPAPARAEAVLDGLVALYGERARRPVAMLERAWGVDPFTRGYITSWAPGDVTARRAAARHPRAAVLRRRLRPLGRRLHGGRGPDRARRRARRARRRASRSAA